MEARLQPNSDILLHHGVKGMRWGVRKPKAQRLADRRKKQIAQAEKKFKRMKSKEAKQLGKLGVTSYTLNKRIKLRNNATKALDAKLKYLQKNKSKNHDAIKNAKQTKNYYKNLNDLAYNRMERNTRNKKILAALATVSGTAMSVPAVRKDVQKGASKVYYKLKNKAMNGGR